MHLQSSLARVGACVSVTPKTSYQSVFTNTPSPSVDGNGTRFQLHLQNGGGATNPAGLPPWILLRKSKSIPIPPAPPPPPMSDLKLANKIDQSRAMPAYVLGVTPPPPGMAADKCVNSVNIISHVKFTHLNGTAPSGTVSQALNPPKLAF